MNDATDMCNVLFLAPIIVGAGIVFIVCWFALRWAIRNADMW